VADDDEGHSLLIHQNLVEAGLDSHIAHFSDGQAVLDNFFDRTSGRVIRKGGRYVILLDIRMPKVDGIEVLRRIRAEAGLHNMPVIMLTTSDDPREVARCYALGCNAYIQKPMDCGLFAEATRLVGQYTQLLLLPEIGCA
jgi:CheY-like chemotaxis protein